MINQGVPRRYLEADKMINRIGIAIAFVSILISCLVFVGCTPLPGYIVVDSGSALMNPTFHISGDQYFQERLRIGRIKVEKVLHSSEEKKRWELDSLQNDTQTVWELALTFSDTDSIIVGLGGWLTTPIVSSLTYGKVPWGYEEKVKALPLEAEQLYIVEMDASVHRNIIPLKFIIRSAGTSTPERLEYRLSDNILLHTRDSLSLD